MKILKLSLVLLVLLLTPSLAFPAGLGYLRLSLVRGEVQVKTPEAADWDLAPVNMPLAEGDEIWVPPGGRAELQLNSGSYIRLDENSSLQVLSLDSDASQFYVPQGRAYLYFNAPRGVVCQLDSPDASTRAFHKASFGVEVFDSFTEVAVYKGNVETENAVGKARIEAGQAVALGEDSYGEIASLGLASDWEEWNRMRDRRILARRGNSMRYLPPELAVYASDFDSSGRWVYAPGYGYVWKPTVADPDWSPYRQGRWIWRGGEYVWVGFEPWGWAPYHYGRWAFVSSFGWCWTAPARGSVYWGPGYVGWVRSPEYVGWVPLAPGETYYGRGYYGPNSVNVTNVNVTQVNINIYKNVQVNRGVTVVRRETFNTPAPARVNLDRSAIQRTLFTRSNLSVGAPDIRPSRVTYAPSARRAPAAKLPPQHLRSLRVQEVRQARPLVKDPAKPVLAPRRAELPVTVVNTPRTPGKRRPAPAAAAARAGQAAPSIPSRAPRGRSATSAPTSQTTAPAAVTTQPAAPKQPAARTRPEPPGHRRGAATPAPTAPATPAVPAPGANAPPTSRTVTPPARSEKPRPGHPPATVPGRERTPASKTPSPNVTAPVQPEKKEERTEKKPQRSDREQMGAPQVRGSEPHRQPEGGAAGKREQHRGQPAPQREPNVQPAPVVQPPHRESQPPPVVQPERVRRPVVTPPPQARPREGAPPRPPKAAAPEKEQQRPHRPDVPPGQEEKRQHTPGEAR